MAQATKLPATNSTDNRTLSGVSKHCNKKVLLCFVLWLLVLVFLFGVKKVALGFLQRKL